MIHHRVVLLGPQRLQPTLNKAVAAARVSGPLAAITAGWEERESEDQEMRDHLGGHTINLRVYDRAEDVMRRDPELNAAIRERQDRLRVQHDLYRVRLAHAMAAARELLHREQTDGYSEMLNAEREAAIEAVRTLDGFHLMKVVDVHHEFEDRLRPLERSIVEHHRREMAHILNDCGALCVAGGHVVALLHRMRLFDVLGLVEHKPIFAWSAGAMALGERVVLFHDNPPQGTGNAELFEEGLSAYSGVLPLPHARHRLHLHDRTRVALMARRFAPAQVVAFDALTRMEWNGSSWHGDKGTLRLTEGGVMTQAGAA
ncbi:MAG: hypothetical protein JNL28_16815 [Planctomycetes bacterium]|nr:hypothetical protein [Planctomycetota bacterium]